MSNFEYVQKVIRSCKTIDQVSNLYDWLWTLKSNGVLKSHEFIMPYMEQQLDYIWMLERINE